MKYLIKYDENNKAIGGIKSIHNRDYDGYIEVTEEEYNIAMEEWNNNRPITPAEFQSMLEEVL